MIEQAGTESGSWWATGGVVALWLGKEAWAALRERRKVRTETDANVELIDSLRQAIADTNARVAEVEGKYLTVSKRLDDEISARQQAQELAHRLRLRVEVLESELRKVGAVIPLEH